MKPKLFLLLALITGCSPSPEIEPSIEPQAEQRSPSLESQVERRNWSCYSSSGFPDGESFKSFSLREEGTFSSLNGASLDPTDGFATGNYEVKDDQLIIKFNPNTNDSTPNRGVWTFTISQIAFRKMFWDDGQVKCRVTKEFF